MIPARMDTMTAVGHLTDSVTTMPIITATAPCSQLLAQEAVPLEEVSRHQTRILTLEYETRLLLLTQHDVTCTEMTEDDVPIEPIITDEADHLIPHSRGSRRLNGPQGRRPKHLIPPKEHPYLPGEAQDRDLTADLQAPTLSAAPAAQAVAGVTWFVCFHNKHSFKCCCSVDEQKLTDAWFVLRVLVFFLFFLNSDSNSSSSDGSRARSIQSSAANAPHQSSMILDCEEPRRSFGIKVQNLPVRSTG